MFPSITAGAESVIEVIEDEGDANEFGLLFTGVGPIVAVPDDMRGTELDLSKGSLTEEEQKEHIY